MATLASYEENGEVIEVRSAGRTRRMYIDGVLHTQYNPGLPVTGDVWDAFLLAAFLLKPKTLRRVLLLGLGGGAALKLLERYINPDELVAVELSKRRILLAKKFFGIKGKKISLLHHDAVKWVREYRGAPFDLVIDDCFVQENKIPKRAIPLDLKWWESLNGLVSSHGALVINCATRAELARTHPMVFSDESQALFPSAFRFNFKMSDNEIAVFSREKVSKRFFREQLYGTKGLGTRKAKSMLRFRLTKVW